MRIGNKRRRTWLIDMEYGVLTYYNEVALLAKGRTRKYHVGTWLRNMKRFYSL